MIKFAPFITIYNFDESGDLQNEVIWTFSSFLKGVSSIRHRFNIYIIDDIQKERQQLDGSVKSMWKYFSIDMYLNASKNKRKKMLLDLITNCFLDAAKELNWDEKLIIEANQNAIKHNICFHYNSKPIRNKTRECSAVVDLKLSKNIVSISILFSFKNNPQLIKKLLINTKVEQVSLFRNFNKPKWISSSQFGFQFKNGITLSISAESSERVWGEVNSKMYNYFKKLIDSDEKVTPEELAKLANW